MKKYISYKIHIPQSEQSLELAILLDKGFESFIEEDEYLEAFIAEDELKIVKSDIESYLVSKKYTYEITSHDPQDWNSIWESNFDDIVIKNQLHIRAEFHPKIDHLKYELTISPKMAFGTGHHATTFQILEWMIDEDFTNKTVLDFGCGTGILGIFAKLKNCKELALIDIEEQAIDNVKDTLALNNIDAEYIGLGSTEQIQNKKYDIIFANITRNVILETAEILLNHLAPKGKIILSGFILEDRNYISSFFESRDLNLTYESMKTDWLCLVYQNK